MRSSTNKDSAKKKKTTTERVADLERKLKTVRTTTMQLEQRVKELEEWGDSLVNTLINCGGEVGGRFSILEGANQNLFSILDRMLPDEGAERSIIRSGLGGLVEQGGAIPIDGNAANIFRQLPHARR